MISMEGTRLARTSISELKKRIILAQERKSKITQYLQELWEKYQTGKISRDFYVETAHRHFDGKTLREWVDYYDNYINECETLIRKHRKDILKNQLRVFIFSSILVILLLGVSLYTQPRLVGFLIQEPVPVSEIVTDANATITTTQQQAILGQPVKWTKTISLDKPATTKIRLPEDATNISVNKIAESYSEEINKEEALLKQEDSSPSQEEGSLPSETKFRITGAVISEETQAPLILKFLRRIGEITGQVVQEPLQEIEINDTATEYEIEYETPAPYAIEEPLTTGEGKRVKIIGPETIHYENVLAFTNLDESFNIKNPSSVKIYWREDNSFVPIQKIEDTNNNGIYDYIEWIAPSLSTQTFDIIVITKAEHLDSNRNFISDIYEEVRELDNVWSEEIPDRNYVRVVFEIPLDNNRDITIYPRVISGTPKIEVYEFQGTEVIAEFTSINNNEYNKIFLDGSSGAGLTGEQDVFDLRIVGGSLEINHIIDPSFNLSDDRIIGYEYLDSNGSIVNESDADTIHTWNTKHDYYFNKSSGIQFTNNFQDYWTRNVFCGKYKKGDKWVYSCNDVLTFDWKIDTDNETYVNYTGSKNISIQNKKIRSSIRYHLKTNDSNLTIIFILENMENSDIDKDLGFAWITKDIQINGQEDDTIEVNNTKFLLNQTLDRTYTNLSNAIFTLFDKSGSSLFLKWNESLNYELSVKSEAGQYNAPVTLEINVGTLIPGQKKQTTMFWLDADFWTYNITIFDVGDSTDPGDDTVVGTCQITIQEGTTGTFCGGSNLANLSMGRTYFLRIKGNTTEGDYNYDADIIAETYFVSVTHTDSSTGWSAADDNSDAQYLVPIDFVPTDVGFPIDIMFWSTLMDASITESVADSINYSNDSLIFEEKDVPSVNVRGGAGNEKIINFEGTESTALDTDPENGGFTFNSKDMTTGEFYYWGVIFQVDEDWTDGEIDTELFHHEGEAGDSDQEIQWNWTILKRLGTLNVSISLPTDNTNVNQNETFTINATVFCEGEALDRCGIVTALARYNESSANPDTGISALKGKKPLYDINRTFGGNYTGFSFSTGSEDAFPTDVTFNGTHFYIIGGLNDRVFEYNLSGDYTGFNFSVENEAPTPTGITFNGTYFYIVDSTFPDSVFEYFANGTYTGFSFIVNNQESSSSGIDFNGTHFYVVGTINDRVFEYNLTGDYTGFNFSVENEAPISTGITFDGTHFYVVGTFTDRVYEYNLTGSYTGFSFSVFSEDTNPQGVTFNGTHFYIIGANNVRIYEYEAVGNNLKTSSETLEVGENFTVSWTINATGNIGTSYEIDVLFNSTTYSPDITENDTEDRTIIITEGADTTPPFIEFVSPTPPNATTTSNTSIEINVSITEANLDEVKFNWNTTNYTIYNDSLVLMMNFDNVSALGENDNLVVDISGNGNNGTVTGAIVNTTDCKYGNCYSFDGFNDHISASMNLSSTNIITLSFWLNWNTFSNDDDLAFELTINYNNNAGGFLVDPNSAANGGGKFEIAHSHNGQATVHASTFSRPSTDVFHHYVIIFDKSTNPDNHTVYVDGTLQSIDTFLSIDSTDNFADDTLYFMSRAGGSLFGDGILDEVRVWNRSLSTSEIQQHYFSNLNKYDTDKWLLYVNQSKNSIDGLDDGTYTYQAFASDTSSNLNQTEERTITIDTAANNPPTITNVEAIGPTIDPEEDSVVFITFNFTATDTDGASNINVSSAQGRFQLTGETTRLNTSCVNWSSQGNDVNFTCTIGMYYFDKNDPSWTINVTIKDNSDAGGENSSTTFQYNQLIAIKISPNSFSFDVEIGAVNQTSNNDPTLINNTGNFDVTLGNVQINAIDLAGEDVSTEFIFAANFSVDIDTGGSPPAECDGTSLVNGTYTGITNSILPPGNHSLNYQNETSGQEQLFYCIKEVPSDISSQTYSTTGLGSWTIKIP